MNDSCIKKVLINSDYSMIAILDGEPCCDVVESLVATLAR